MKNGTLSWRVGQLEENYKLIDERLDKILTNDIPHIHESLASLKTRINVMTAINVSAIILGVLVSKIL